jgi:general secretion pathway protein M
MSAARTASSNSSGMSSAAAKTPSAFTRTLGARWQALAPRERLAVTLALWVLALGALWWLALSPALQTLRAADTQRIELERQHQVMLALQTEARGLQGQTKLASGEASKALEASIKQRLGSGALLNVAGERATVSFKGVTGDALAQWLAQVRANAHALPTEAKLTRAVGVPTGTGTGSGSGSGSAGPAASGTSSATGSASPASTANSTSAAATVAWDGSIVLRLP